MRARALRTGNVRGQAERLAVNDHFFFFLFTMADGSAGPNGMSPSPSTTDLMGLIKDSLRELLQDEPALFSQSSRGVTDGVDGESHGGEFCRICHSNGVLSVRRGSWPASRSTLAPVDGHVAGVDGGPSSLAPVEGHAAGADGRLGVLGVWWPR